MTTATPARNAPITFPRRIYQEDGRAVLERFGMRFGDDVSWSYMLVYVTLPDGWWQDVNDRSIIDELGRYRVSVNMKLSSPDSFAIATVLPRLSIKNDVNYEDKHAATRIIVTDGDEIFFRSVPIPNQKRTIEFFNAQAAAADTARAWCQEYRPLWRDPAAYWD